MIIRRERLGYFLLSKYCLLCALLTATLPSFAQTQGNAIFNSSQVHDINIQMTQASWWDSLQYYKVQGDSTGLYPYMVCKITVDGTLIDSSGIRLKGNSSYGFPGQKKPIKIKFNEYVKGQTYDGLKSINLNNNMLDPSHMREKLYLDFLNSKGIAAPRCTYAKVSYNGQYVGLYKIVEEVDKVYLGMKYLNNNGNLFKGDPMGALQWLGGSDSLYYPYYELKTNEIINDWSKLVSLIDNINNTPVNNFRDTLESIMNTTGFIRAWAANNLFVNLDAYFHAPHNYYLYDNLVSNKFEYIQWDVSVAFGFFPYWVEDSTTQLNMLYNNPGLPLTSRMLADTVYRTLYLNSICEYLQQDFLISAFYAKIDSIANVIRPHVYAEPDSNRMFPTAVFEYGMDTMTLVTPIGHIPGLKKFIAKRRDYSVASMNKMGWYCSVGMPDHNSDPAFAQVSVFPNPFTASALITFINNENKECSFTLYNAAGQEIKKRERVSGNSILLYRENLPPGIYFFRITGKDNLEFKGTIIAE